MSNRKILVVDDNLDFAESIAILLESNGRPAIAMASVREALDALDDDPSIGMVITDIRMPGVDGFDFRRVLRHRFASLPVVLMTGLPVTDDDVVPRDVAILQKPFPVEALLKAVAERVQGDTA
jgi:two-component system C4-dicarboxylate transport response regulator DctD